jgi:hypothetical protein
MTSSIHPAANTHSNSVYESPLNTAVGNTSQYKICPETTFEIFFSEVRGPIMMANVPCRASSPG